MHVFRLRYIGYHGSFAFFAFFDIDPIPQTEWDAVCMHVYKYRTNKNGHEQQKKESKNTHEPNESKAYIEYW